MPSRFKIHAPRFWIASLLLGIGLFAYALAASVPAAQAAASSPRPAAQEQKPNDFCLACHQEEGVSAEFGGESLPATINPTRYGLSVHAQEGVACADCHANMSEYPHPKTDAASVRDFRLSFGETCKECHNEEYDAAHDSVHQAALTAGDPNAPLCADCHNPHEQPRIIGQNSGQLTIAARKDLPAACSQCHADQVAVYKNSVHGSALADGNRDVPSCTDCHGVHNIVGADNAFHNNTPALCAECHSDKELMTRYGLSTSVLETYVADFHGTTAVLFEKQFPDQRVDTAVCTDCHGVHDISDPNNPQTGIAMQDNLLTKCQRCHPDATANFPAAWMGHYEPSPTHYPLVYYVNLFYKFFIPMVLGGMIFFVLTDVYRRLINRAKGVKH
ncbi:MAG: ammonia-forming cytochrome c nitrite reductase subunit c552 [Anaerolineales bacterium]|nr:ammonia-forming cytochrome c nitrite reductase subunit c552 [Anaerolineales bacterium]